MLVVESTTTSMSCQLHFLSCVLILEREQVLAVDVDAGENGGVRYELMRGHGELFRVDRNTGHVILKQSLESQVLEYQLSVAAYDGGACLYLVIVLFRQFVFYYIC